MENQKKIRFSGSGASHKNGSSEFSIKKVGTMVRTMIINDVLICTKDTFYNDI